MDAGVALVILILAIALPIASFIFYCYLLFNRKTRAYFSRQSVEIRRQADDRGH